MYCVYINLLLFNELLIVLDQAQCRVVLGIGTGFGYSFNTSRFGPGQYLVFISANSNLSFKI